MFLEGPLLSRPSCHITCILIFTLWWAWCLLFKLWHVDVLGRPTFKLRLEKFLECVRLVAQNNNQDSNWKQNGSKNLYYKMNQNYSSLSFLEASKTCLKAWLQKDPRKRVWRAGEIECLSLPVREPIWTEMLLVQESVSILRIYLLSK